MQAWAFDPQGRGRPRAELRGNLLYTANSQNGMRMFVPTYFDVADSKLNNRFASSDTLFIYGRAGILPLSVSIAIA